MPRIGLAYYFLDEKRVDEAEKIALEARAILEKENFPNPKTPIKKYYALCITGLGHTAEDDVKELFDDIANWCVVASREIMNSGLEQ